jgi:hypothetical protein
MMTFVEDKSPGIYVIEVRQGVVKVGRSQDTDTRIKTHIRNARSVGQDPYRYRVLPVPEDLLVVAERDAHRAVRELGGQPSARATEVFTDVYYNPALAVVTEAVEGLMGYVLAKERLSALNAEDLDGQLAHSPPDVQVVVRRLLADF